MSRPRVLTDEQRRANAARRIRAWRETQNPTKALAPKYLPDDQFQWLLDMIVNAGFDPIDLRHNAELALAQIANIHPISSTETKP